MLRYPGGKEKLKNQIIEPIVCFYKNFKNSIEYEYREVFFGGGAVCLELIKKDLFKDLWINDKDTSLSFFWNSVINNHLELIDEIKKYNPSPENFNLIKSFLNKENFENESEVSTGVKKLIIHRTSFSGLGTMSGPLGGNEQKGKYKNDSRWNPKYLIENINAVNIYFKTKNIRNNKCTNLDCMDVLNDNSKKWFAYLDPPYYQMGDVLYPVKFNHKQHEELANFLQNTDQYWILSYDDCHEIRKLYSWANIKEIEANYSIVGAKKKKELLIFPNQMKFTFDILDKLKPRNIF